MSEIEKLNMIAEWQEQYKQLIEDLDNSKKRIEELEKEIARLTTNEKSLLAERKIIVKENAELKTRVENQKSFLERIRAKFNLGEIDRKEIEGYLENDQLTKAKELLKRCYDNYIYLQPLRGDIEQFLKEYK